MSAASNIIIGLICFGLVVLCVAILVAAKRDEMSKWRDDNE